MQIGFRLYMLSMENIYACVYFNSEILLIHSEILCVCKDRPGALHDTCQVRTAPLSCIPLASKKSKSSLSVL